MIAFWIAAFLATAAAAALVVLYARRPVAILADPAKAVYLRQLEEIDDLAARGLIEDEERRTARAEAGRRALTEQGATPESPPAKGGRIAVAAAIAAVGLAAAMAYLAVGHPGMPDQPFKARVKAWREQDPTSLQPEELLILAKEALKIRPGNAELQQLIARLQIQAGDEFSAARSLESALRVEPRSADGWSLLGQLRVRAADNKITPEAREALLKAMALDPKAVAPRYLIGRSDIELGRRDEGLALWRGLLPEMPADGRETLSRQIASVEAGGGPIPGPEGAARTAGPPTDPAIRAMVDGLAARLKENPNDPAGWARLVRSYTVLQDEAALKGALAQARVIFKDRPRDLAAIEAAADVPQ